MTSLYMTSTRLANLLESAIANGGEIPGDAAGEWGAWLDGIAEDEPLFLLELVNAIDQLTMEAAASRAAAEQWISRATSRENTIIRIKAEIMRYLSICGKKKAKLDDGRELCAQSNGGSLPIRWAELVDPNNIPDRFRKTRVELDRDAVRAALETGEHLPEFGELLPRGSHVRVR